jgi:hypothetical protein
MSWAGIDPGFTGAIAWLNDAGRSITLVDTPVIEVPYVKNGKRRKRQEFDIREICKIFRANRPDFVALESVTARSGQGVTSMFRFGHGLGMWEGVLTALGIDYAKVLPVEWKKKFGLLSKDKEKNKDASRLFAIAEFPAQALNLRFKKHHGRADALLLAEYGRQTRWIEKCAHSNDSNPTN